MGVSGPLKGLKDDIFRLYQDTVSKLQTSSQWAVEGSVDVHAVAAHVAMIEAPPVMTTADAVRIALNLTQKS